MIYISLVLYFGDENGENKEDVKFTISISIAYLDQEPSELSGLWSCRRVFP